MKGKWSRLWASVVTIAMMLGLVATIPASATNEKATADSTASNVASMPQFQGTSDLVQQVAKDLAEDGQVYEEKAEDEKLAATVQEKSGLTLGTVKTELGFALFDNYETGVIDTAEYGLNKAEMTDVMTETLRDNYLTNIVTYELKTDDGIVTAINYEMRETFTSGLEAIDEVSVEPEAQEPVSVVAEEANQPMLFSNTPAVLDDKGGDDGKTTEPHTHEYTAEFHWDKGYRENADADEDGKPDLGLVFDPDTKEIKTSEQTTIYWYVDSAELKCADCGDTITINPNTIQINAFYVDAEKLGTEIDVKYAPYANCVIYEATCTVAELGENGADVTFTSEIFNASERELQIHYTTMCAFNEAYANHFGVVTPYWTSKNTDMSPIGAVKSLCNMYPDDYVPAGNLDYMVNMLSQAFMAYEMKLGQLLDMRINDCISRLDDSMTDIQKLLVIHDWLANNASFDMSAITAMKSGESAGSDPSQMTAFGTLMPELLGFNGCICLGYAATYALLVQHAFPEIYQDENGSWKTPEDIGDDAMVDFVQCRFYADIAETSVAGPDSGFGEEGTMFNETHYYNAVKVDNNWYYVDACYDDIYCEVMSQYRVETDGNISHNYFMFAPTSALDMFDGYIDYIDSQYDGVIFERTVTGQDENGLPVYEKDEDGHVIWTKKDTDKEKAYDDTTYEETWFTGAIGEINFDGEYWYYTAGEINSYAAMSDMMGDNDMGDFDMGDFDMSDMLANDGPEYADRVVRRPRTAADEPDDKCKKEVEYSFEMNGQQQTGTREVYDDAYDEVLFHYGYGTLGDPTEEEETSGGKYKELVDLDASYNDLYPDLAHTTGMYNGVLYFNVANKIYSLDTSKVANGITQIKEYNEVHANTDGRDFTGMSFYAAEDNEADNYAFTVTNHPIAAISVEDRVVYSEDGVPSTVPTMTVSIGTNYSESYTVDGETSYQVEAVNYNPDYNSYMDDGSDPDINKNTEFMWCANVVERMEMATLLDALTSGETEDVTVAPWCGQDGFTEARTTVYGLSDGTEKTVDEGSALKHHYVYYEGEEWHICDVCKAVYDQEEKGHVVNETPKFTWAEDYSTCTAAFTCAVETCGYEEKEQACEVTSEVTTKPTEAKTGTIEYTATYKTDNGQEYTDKQTAELPVLEHAYGEPEFKWTEDYSGCKAVFTCPNEDCKESERTVTCDVTQETVTEPSEIGDGHVEYTATCTFNGKTYTDIQKVAVPHAYGEPEFKWTEDHTECEAVFTCTTEGCGHTENVTCTVEEKTLTEPTEAKTGTVEYTASCELDGETYTDVQEVEVPKLEHAYGEPEFKWTEDHTECEAVFTCPNADCETSKVIIPCKVEETESKEPTETEDGFEKYVATCTFDGQNYTDEQTVELPALGHAYGEPVFTWSADRSTCTATFTCTRDCGNQQTVDCKVTSRVSVEPSKDDDGALKDGGTVEYTATCEFEGKEYKEVKSVVNPFVDVKNTAWYFEEVMYCYSNGIMKGTSANTFEPSFVLNRAMIAQIIYNLEGRPEVEKKGTFTDVADDAWYADAVNWAAENGLVKGFEDNTFRPYEDASREQMATILYRYAKYKGYDTEVSGDLSVFTDAEEVHNWALEAMRWAVGHEIFRGRGDGVLAPRSNTKRSETAQLFVNILEKFEV